MEPTTSCEVERYEISGNLRMERVPIAISRERKETPR